MRTCAHNPRRAAPTDVPVEVIESELMPPKKAHSAYQLFCAAKRAEVARELGDNAAPTEVAKALGARWQELDAEDRGPFDAGAERERARYGSEIAVYEQKLAAEAEAEQAKRSAGGPSEREAERAQKRARLAEEVEERAAAPKAARVAKERTAGEAQLDRQNERIEADKKSAADARLRFLFGQSDLFKHFGFATDLPAHRGKGAIKKGRPRGRMTEKEEDDQLLAAEDEAAGAAGSSGGGGRGSGMASFGETVQTRRLALTLRPASPLPPAPGALPSCRARLPPPGLDTARQRRPP